MSRARPRALALLLAAVLGAVAIALWARGRAPAPLGERPAAQRPALMLLTSLPLMFGEEFSLAATGSPALDALQQRYRVVSISVTEPAELAKARLLLMAQPLAQPAEHLVALDEWVRAGGRVLLLADPLLEWPGKRPLGDPLRPPAMFADTGLLAHWGLSLDAPDARGTRSMSLGRHDILTVSPGRLSGDCAIGEQGLVARCRLGKGKATIVADADLLDAERLGSGAEQNLDALLAELARLERR